MALRCPVDLDINRLQQEIRAMYVRVATDPEGDFHFHRGPEYAARVLGYEPAALASLPSSVTASFAGMGNPHSIAPIPEGAVVLDIGSGSGTDLLLAARSAGSTGRVIGVDMTDEMITRALAGAAECGLANVEVRHGEATTLPLDDESVDVVISNGVLNLVPDKVRASAEIARVLRPGGRLQIGDIVIGVELPESARRDVELWSS